MASTSRAYVSMISRLSETTGTGVTRAPQRAFSSVNSMRPRTCRACSDCKSQGGLVLYLTEASSNLAFLSASSSFRLQYASSTQQTRCFHTIHTGLHKPIDRSAGEDSWWYRYVHGINPGNPEQAKMAKLWLADGIDPLLMDRTDHEDFKKFFLMEQRHFKVEDEAKAWANVKDKYRLRYTKIRQKCQKEC